MTKYESESLTNEICDIKEELNELANLVCFFTYLTY